MPQFYSKLTVKWVKSSSEQVTVRSPYSRSSHEIRSLWSHRARPVEDLVAAANNKAGNRFACVALIWKLLGKIKASRHRRQLPSCTLTCCWCTRFRRWNWRDCLRIWWQAADWSLEWFCEFLSRLSIASYSRTSRTATRAGHDRTWTRCRRFCRIQSVYCHRFRVPLWWSFSPSFSAARFDSALECFGLRIWKSKKKCFCLLIHNRNVESEPFSFWFGQIQRFSLAKFSKLSSPLAPNPNLRANLLVYVF